MTAAMTQVPAPTAIFSSSILFFLLSGCQVVRKGAQKGNVEIRVKDAPTAQRCLTPLRQKKARHGEPFYHTIQILF